MKNRKICITFSLLCLFLSLSYSYAQEKEQVPHKVQEERYTRKSITRMKLSVPSDVERIYKVADFLLGFDLTRFLEEKIKSAIEIERFDYNQVNVSANTDIETLARLVKEYVDAVKVDRAKAEAQIDWRFKDLVITADDIRKIADSAYIYSPKVKNLDVNVFIVPRNRRIEMTIWCSIGIEVAYYKVDFDTGKPILVFKTYDSQTERVKVGKIELLPLPFPFSLFGPEVDIIETPLDAFERCMVKAIFWVGGKINRSMRRIPDFALTAPIVNSSSFYVYSPLTKRDKVYIDSDFRVLERQEFERDGKKEEVFRSVGWVRARKVADGEKEVVSAFQILSGSPEVGHIIREYSLLNIGLVPSFYFLPSLGFSYESLSPKVSLPKSSSGGFAFSLGVKANFATAFSINVSEFYLISDLYLLAQKTVFELGGRVGLKKKFYFRNLGVNPSLTFDFARVLLPFTRTDVGVDVTAGDYILGISPALTFEWFFHPRFSIFAGGGYRFMTVAENFTYNLEGAEFSLEGARYNPSGIFFLGGFEITIW
jgi:hypothetical protein